MAVTEIRVRTERAGKLGEKHDRNYSLTYLVTTNDAHDGPLTVFASLPQIGDNYLTNNEFDLGARVSGISLEHVDGDPRRWRAEVEFSSTHGDNPDEPQPEDPTDREPKYGVRFDQAEVAVQGPYSSADPGNVDVTTSMTNSRKQPYNPPPTREERMPVITVLIDDADLKLHSLVQVQDLVNATAFAGFPAKTLKLNISDVKERFENGRRLWQKTYEIAYSRRTWDLFILDHGTIQDEEGNFDEVLLKNGSKTTGAPQYKQYTVCKQIDFATSTDVPDAVRTLLNLPN